MCLIMINLQKFKMIIKQKNLANYSFAEKEIAKLFSEFGFKIIDNSPQSICNKFIETIPDIESMRDWSAYYLFEVV